MATTTPQTVLGNSKKVIRKYWWIILVIWGVLTIPVTIGTGKVGVVTRFGKVTGREMNEGLNAKLPWPFERVWIVDTRVQKEEASAEAASADLQVVHSTLAVNYHLERGEVSEMYRTVGPDFKERIIDPVIQEVFKATTAQYTASELLTKRPEVKENARKLLTERFSPRGITLDDLSILNFDFSSDFNKAIEQKQVAQQEAERAKFVLEKARQEAEAQNVQKTTLSQEVLQKMAIEKWDGKLPQYLGDGTVFNIPLGR